VPTVNSASTDSSTTVTHDLNQLDQLTGGAFTAPTSGERASRVREWLATDPSVDLMQAVFRELSSRDKGAARALKDRLDDIKRARLQEGLVAEWASKAQQLLEQARLNVADAMAWQRDAAKVGAPLSREPLATLRQQLTERVKAVDDLQTRIQVAREAAVLLAQRIEVLSTKPLQDAQNAHSGLSQDVTQWGVQADALMADAQWASIEPKFVTLLDGARAQLKLVWDAFDAALTQGVAALTDVAAPLPAVPVWSDEIRTARGEVVAEAAAPTATKEEVAAARAKAGAAVQGVASKLAAELEQGHGKTIPRLAQELRQTLKEHHRWLTAEVEGAAQALLAQAGDMEGWQRWRADQLRQELVTKAEALTTAPEGQRLGGRKIQETLRNLREAWKQTDQGGAPNHALWKKFDDACNRAHKSVEEWLNKLRQESAEHKAQRLVLIQEVDAWAQAHAQNTDWRLHARELHRLAEAWRHAGHLSEKLFAELQPLWKAAMQKAHAPLEAAQATNLDQRQALIARAGELGAAAQLRLDAVKALQHEWQVLAQAVPLDRRQEQKLWEAFRQPIDQAFQRKDQARVQQAEALSALDRRVMDAARQLQDAIQSHDAQRIQAALAALDRASHDEPVAEAVAPVAISTEASETADAAEVANAEVASTHGDVLDDAVAAPVPASKPTVKKVVAVRGDDRPGAKRTEPVAAAGRGRFEGRKPGERDGRRPDQRPVGRFDPRDGGRFDHGRDRETFAPRGPRLGDAAFRAKRDAQDHAQLALKKLAAQAHGQSLTQLMDAWKTRNQDAMPQAQELGGRVQAGVRQGWAQAVGKPAQVGGMDGALLRLEMAAELPTPAQHLDARRALQLQLLTRRNDPAPAQTWAQDVAQTLACEWQQEAAERLMPVLKALIRKS